LRRAPRLPFAILAILLVGIVGAMLFRATADQKPHSVLLQWNPPVPSPGLTVTGYIIYRNLPDGTYKPIATGVPGPSFVDHHVSNGTTYRYFVTAVDSAGHEGVPTDPVSAVIP
jgi:hypothetical protein